MNSFAKLVDSQRDRLSQTRYLTMACFIFLILLSLHSYADFHFEPDHGLSLSGQEASLVKEIESFLAIYAQAYNQQNYKAVKSMWKKADLPIYLAEEVPMPLYGWKRIDKYFDPIPGKKILDGIFNEYTEVRAKKVSDDVVVATYRLDYDIKIINQKPLHGWSRIMSVFVKEESGWKLSAYSEAPMGPLTMVKKMMKQSPAQSQEQKQAYETTKKTIKGLLESTVTPEFESYLSSQKDQLPIQ